MLINFTIYISIFLSYGSDEFFKNLQKKPIKEQYSILEKRIKIDAQSEGELTTDENIGYYLKLSASNPLKTRYLGLQIKKAKDKNFRLSASIQIYKYCKMRLGDCIKALGPDFFSYCHSIDECKTLRPEIIREIFIFENLEAILNAKLTFYEVLKGPFGLVEEEEVVRSAVNFGFYSNVEALVEKNSSLKTGALSEFYYCSYLLYKELLSEAQKCFSSNSSDDWSKLMSEYVRHLMGQEIKSDVVKAILENIVKNATSKTKMFAIVMDILFFKTTNISVTETDIAFLSEDLSYTYLILQAHKKYNFLRPDDLSKIDESFKRKHSSSILYKIYKNQIKNEFLKSHLGGQSFLYKLSQ